MVPFDPVAAAQLTRDILGDVLPPLLKFIKNRSTNGHIVRAKDYIEEARKMMKPIINKMTDSEFKAFKKQLKICEQMQTQLVGQRGFPKSLKPHNIELSRELKLASRKFWDLCDTTSSKIQSRELLAERKEMQDDTRAHLELRDGIDHLTGGLPAPQVIYILRASCDPPGSPLPPNGLGITDNTRFDLSKLSKPPKCCSAEMDQLQLTGARALASTSRYSKVHRVSN